MKKLLSLILAMMAFVIPSVADDQQTDGNSPTPITLDTDTKINGDGSDRHRAPIRISIEAYYNPVTQSIDIYYSGGASGEVFLYLDDTIIGYDSNINTSFPISAHGLYKIEIIGESWSAEGYIQL